MVDPSAGQEHAVLDRLADLGEALVLVGRAVQVHGQVVGVQDHGHFVDGGVGEALGGGLRAHDAVLVGAALKVHVDGLEVDAVAEVAVVVRASPALDLGAGLELLAGFHPVEG